VLAFGFSLEGNRKESGTLVGFKLKILLDNHGRGSIYQRFTSALSPWPL